MSKTETNGGSLPLEKHTAAPVACGTPGRLDDGMQIRCRKCGEQATIACNSARIVTHNPHTGMPRDERDIASDPEGKLIVAPGPLPAATMAAPAAPLGRYKLADDGSHDYLDGIESRYSIKREDGTTLAWVNGDKAAADELLAAIGAAKESP